MNSLKTQQTYTEVILLLGSACVQLRDEDGLNAIVSQLHPIVFQLKLDSNFDEGAGVTKTPYEGERSIEGLEALLARAVHDINKIPLGTIARNAKNQLEGLTSYVSFLVHGEGTASEAVENPPATVAPAPEEHQSSDPALAGQGLSSQSEDHQSNSEEEPQQDQRPE